jgi:malonyl-CoA/methylmalonyl-CoA synthetase
VTRLLQMLQTPEETAIAIEDARGAHAWGDVRRRARAGAAKLASWRDPGVDGPRIGMLLEPGADWLAVLLAILEAGAIAVPLSPQYPDRELGALLDDADVSLVVCSRALQRGGLAVWQVDVDAFLSADPSHEAADVGTPPREPDVAMLLFTSGTTGRPKGVCLQHDKLAHQLTLLIDVWQLRHRHALLHALPLHHTHGIAIALLPCLAAGMRARMLRFDADEVWAALGNVDTFMAVPTMYHRLLAAYDREPALQRSRRQAATWLSLCTSGSAALPVGLAARWQSLTGAIPLERWGMTELGVGLCNPLDPNARRRGWVGHPLPSLSLHIAQDDGWETDRGTLWVRGPSVFERYWQRPDATTAAIVDGWFDTGDIVERDAQGRVRIVGRRSVDIIKSGGYKLSALEIEEQLRDHPAVADVAVVGIDDEAWGQRIAAAVVARGDLGDIAAWCRERLAPYKVPKNFLVVDALPKNALGKVVKRDVVALLSK